MRTLLALVALTLLAVPCRTEAGESRHLGVMTLAGASLTNITTAVPFNIPQNSKITITCTAAMQILTDAKVVSTGTTGTKGVAIVSGERFPTSVSAAFGAIAGTPTAVIAIIGTGTCDVWLRLGTE